MIFLSITRLRIRSVWFLFPFFRINRQSLQQLKIASGFVGGKLLLDRKLTFWTLTAWETETAMRAYRNSGAHLKAMSKLMDWCDEGHAAHWSQQSATLPTWAEGYSRITAPEARISKVRHPTAAHLAKRFPPPRYPSKLEQQILPKK